MTEQLRPTDWFRIAIPGLIWGTSFLFIAEGLEAVGPNGVTFLRLVIGFLTLACFPGAWKSIPRSDWKWIAAVGLVWMAFPLSMFPYAEQRVTSALTGMLNGGVPLTTAIVAAVIGYGVALNIARPLQVKYGSLPVIWRAQAVAVLLTAPLGIGEVAAAHWSLWPILALLGLGAGGTAIAFIAMTANAGKFGATRASSTTFLMPPVALLLGVLVRHERVELLSVIGGAICILGAWVMARAQLSHAPAPAK